MPGRPHSVDLTAEQAAQVRAITKRHARLVKGRGVYTFPMRCQPSRDPAVARERGGLGSAGKVIYDTREAAEAAAREIERIVPERLYAYECPRSSHGHHHLTTRR